MCIYICEVSRGLRELSPQILDHGENGLFRIAVFLLCCLPILRCFCSML